ncbi:GDSL-type esterase/lipase family protein [Prosthecobacter sp.]|uniref:GDSL-type esterase/lipase family protein n=1 Tax=Prosthecobacter sp. TaxID=1965333 RepID=UPI002AB9A009|nr:GDSL-type esterase/lipase family protein [Prosthecobacter sp.]MDZ4403562.1 GDSL-type esterase/lipase family protein [Prosthecobacter sp.]
MLRTLFLSGFLFTLSVQAQTQPRVVLAGDSTVATVNEAPKDRPTLAGWGQMLQEFMPKAQIINHARSGTSTMSFRALGLWDRVLKEKADWVLIQFGHNDQPGKGPERETDAATTYRENLRRFITEVRDGGGKPVLITSVARRVYVDGKMTSTLTPYVEAVKVVGQEMQVPVVDLHQASFALFDQMGEKFCKLYGPSDTDRTHFSTEGARMIARLVAEGLAREVPELRSHLQLVPPPPAGLPFEVKHTIVSEGYDGKTCWVHPRAGAIPGKTPSVVLTMQKLLLTGSDVFFALNDTRSDDLGQTWSPITEHGETLGRRSEPDDVIVATCDFTPKWHAKSGKLLGIGHTVRYSGDKVIHDRKRETAYAVYDEKTRQWTSWTTLEMPDDPRFHSAGAGSVQRVDLDNGDILLPIYFKGKTDKYYSVTVLRCVFDGTKLLYREHGDVLTLESGRGVYEPSLMQCGGRFYLTLRNDTAGYVSVSDDGKHFSKPAMWCWEDGTELGNYNTQQHWVTHADRLYLVYTRKGAHNDHVFRHRAPLFMAEVNRDTLRVKRATEVVLVPEHGARLGNFGVCEVSANETWVTVAEWMQTWGPNVAIRPGHPLGANNRVHVARILWKK